MSLELLDEYRFESFCNQLVRTFLERSTPGSSSGYRVTSKRHRADAAADAVLVDGRYAGNTTGLVLFSFKTTEETHPDKSRKLLQSYILRDIEKQAARKPVEVVVLVNRPLLESDIGAIERKVAHRFLLTVLDARQLAFLAEPYPHILWRWFDRCPYIRAVPCGDVVAVVEALGLSAQIPLQANPRHPALDAITAPLGNTRIVGQAGSGKSTAIAQVAVSTPQSTLVVVQPAQFTSVWEPLRRLVLEAMEKLIVVFANFHEACSRGQADAFLDLVRAIRNQTRGRDLPVIVEYRASGRESVHRAVPEETWNDLGFDDEVLLDPAPDAFMEQVFDAACERFSVKAGAAERRRWVRAVQEIDGTPLAMVEAVSDYRGSRLPEDGAFRPLPLAAVADRWRSRFVSLCSNPGRHVEARLLQTFSVMRLAGLPIVADPAILSRCSVAPVMDTGHLSGALEGLEHEGWVTVGGGRTVRCHDIRIMPYVVGLYAKDGGATKELLEYARRLWSAGEFEERPHLAAAAGRMLISCECWRDAGEILRVAQRSSPADARLRLELATCSSHSDDEDTVRGALTDLREIAQVNPSDPAPAQALASALLRRGRREDAVISVEDLLVRGGAAPERCQIAGIVTFVTLMDYWAAAYAARRVLQSPVTTESAKALAASFLAQVGFAREAEGILLELSHGDHPSPDVRLGLSCCFQATRRPKEAVMLLQGLLTDQPSHPGPRLQLAELVVAWPEGDVPGNLAQEALDSLLLAEKLLRYDVPATADVLAAKALLLACVGKRDEAQHPLRGSAVRGGPHRFDIRLKAFQLASELGDDETAGMLASAHDRSEADLLVQANRLREAGDFGADAAQSEAAILLRNGLRSRGESVLRGAIAKEPCHPGCTGMLAQLLADQGRWEEAAATLRMFRMAGGGTAYAQSETHCWSRCNEYENALEAAEVGLTERECTTQMIVEAAQATYFGLKDYGRCLELLARVQFVELDAASRALLVACSDATGRRNEALEYARRSVTEWPSDTRVPPAVLFPLCKYGSDGDVDLAVGRLYLDHPTEWDFTTQCAELANLLDAANLGDNALRLCHAAVHHLPGCQPLAVPLVLRLCQRGRWADALAAINGSFGSFRQLDIYPELLRQACEGLGVLEELLRSPLNVLDKYDHRDGLVIGTAIAAKRYGRAIELLADGVARGYWLPRGGLPLVPAQDQDAVRLAATTWLQKNLSHPGRAGVLALEGALSRVDRETYASILIDATRSPARAGALLDLAAWYEATGKVQELLEVSDEILKERADNPAGWKSRILALAGLGLPDEAVACAEHALELVKDPLVRASIRAQRAFALRDLMARQPAEDAKNTGERVLQDVAFARRHGIYDSLSAYAEVAVLLALGRLDEAYRASKHALHAHPNSCELLYSHALLLGSMARHEELLEIPLHDVILGMHPCSVTVATVWWEVGWAWAKTRHDLSTGEKSFGQLLRRFEVSWTKQGVEADELARSGLLSLWRCATQLKMEDDLLALLADLSDTWRENPMYWIAVAHVSMRLGNYEDARSALEALHPCCDAEGVISSKGKTTEVGHHSKLSDPQVLGPWLETLVEVELQEDWTRAVTILATAATNPELGIPWTRLCARAVAMAPSGTRIGEHFAIAILGACSYLPELSDSGVEQLRERIGRLLLDEALADCEERPTIAAALASILLRADLLTHPAIARLATRSGAVRSALQGCVGTNLPSIREVVAAYESGDR